jgi:hypothetical protein
VRAAVALVALALAATAVPARAVETPLTPRSVNDALDAGHAMADAHGGYTIAPYLLFTVPDAVLITDDDATVEAVQVGTPFERLRFEAYREQLMRRPFNAPDVATYNELHAGRVDFIVYAHSRTDKDRTFLDHFGGGALVRTDGTTAGTAEITRSVAVVDTYTKPGGVVVNRYLGQVTYRFTLSDAVAAAAPLIFSFTDDHGAEHRLPLTLANYR